MCQDGNVVCSVQGLSVSALLAFWVGSFFVVCAWGVDVLILVECLVATLASTHEMPVAPLTCDNQKCLQTLPSVPKEAQSPPVENHCRISVILLFPCRDNSQVFVGLLGGGGATPKDRWTQEGDAYWQV